MTNDSTLANLLCKSKNLSHGTVSIKLFLTAFIKAKYKLVPLVRWTWLRIRYSKFLFTLFIKITISKPGTVHTKLFFTSFIKAKCKLDKIMGGGIISPTNLKGGIYEKSFNTIINSNSNFNNA